MRPQTTRQPKSLANVQADLPNMGLTAFKGSRVRKEDIIIAKNYLTEDEIDTLNRLVTLFLDTAELRIKDQLDLSLEFWKTEVDGIITFSRKKLLLGLGKISHDSAKDYVENQYTIFDNNRKNIEANLADEDDNKIMQELIKKSKKKR